jgi:hypothetical protein
LKYLLLFLFAFGNHVYSQNIEISEELIQRLKSTQAINMDQIIKELDLVKVRKNNAKKFKLANPFFPMTTVHNSEIQLMKPINGQVDFLDNQNGMVSFFHQRAVFNWYNKLPKEERDQQVCGFKFSDQHNKKYKLKSFANAEEARREGYLVTHQYHCGACSSLYDLAIYLEKRNMVNNGRKCARRFIANKSKDCHIKRIGLSPICAEAWAYNAIMTRKRCKNICIKEYGLINTIFNKFPDEYVNEDGSLKPCILCDELKSGGGYRYSSGRTRRSSGIKSGIQRNPDDLFFIDYNLYYELFSLKVKD